MPYLPEELADYIVTSDNEDGLKISEDAPEEIKKKFREWRKEVEVPTIEIV